MTSSIELIPLICVRCQTPVPAESDQVAWSCTQCGQGLLLDENVGLVAQEIYYAQNDSAELKGKPFWVAKGRVNLDREAHQEWFDQSQKQAGKFWQEEILFVIPAYILPIEELIDLSIKMLSNPPEFAEGSAFSYIPVTLSPNDLPTLVEFIVLAIEAGRKDKVKQLEVAITLEKPTLWILPGSLID
jgi:hypothetical protein